MLPDYPNIKEKLKKKVIEGMEKRKAEYLGPLSHIAKIRIFEGNKVMLVKEDGSVEQLPIKEIAVEMEIRLKEIEAMRPEIILDKFDAVAKEMAVQQSKQVFKKIEEIVKKVGNVIDTKGRAYCIDDFFHALEMIQMDFDENGRPYLPTFICGEKAYESISEVLPQLDTDPECKKRFAEIIAKKKEEWRAREINRKLVG